MVQHHVKRKKRNRQKELKKKITEEDLDKFAGSSEEEEGFDYEKEGDNDEENGDEQLGDSSGDEQLGDSSGDEQLGNSSGDDVDEGASSESSRDHEKDVEDEIEIKKDEGMANAMSRILHSHSNTVSNVNNPVLSKTVTSLQKSLKENRTKSRKNQRARKKRRDEALTVMHVPVVCGNEEVITDIENERKYKRIATRGVVALFNAISNHQFNLQPSSETNTKSNKNTHITKYKFLDMLKQTAVQNDGKKNQNIIQFNKSISDEQVVKNQKKMDKTADKNTKRWKALSDDFLMGSSTIKDWDKNLSGDESESDYLDENKTINLDEISDD